MTVATNIGASPLRSPSPRLAQTPAVWAILALWGFSAWALGAQGVFESEPASPPLATLIAAVGPVLAFLAAYAGLAPLRRWIEALDIAEVLALQSWRIIGAAFLFVWALGELPAAFAFPAGVGDIAVGLAAPTVALAAHRKAAGWRAGAYGLTAAGLADFVGAFATGILSREGAALHFAGAPASSLLGVPPLGLFPTFIVPAFLILHAITLIKLREPRP